MYTLIMYAKLTANCNLTLAKFQFFLGSMSHRYPFVALIIWTPQINSVILYNMLIMFLLSSHNLWIPCLVKSFFLAML